MDKADIACAKCPFGDQDRICKRIGGPHPDFCGTINAPDTHKRAKEIYLQEDTLRFAQEAARQEKDCAANIDGKNLQIKPRIVETVEFCKRMGYKHLGFAFCGGLVKEARIVNEILETNGFKVTSVMCKVGAVDKTFLGLTDEEKKKPGQFESMCNNIDQALILNDAGTEFNIVMGLCVGHDSLFLENSKARCTVLASKDRLTGHCPLQPIYLYDSFYGYLKKPL